MTKDWERVKGTILNLYQTQGKTVAETRKAVEEIHGFKASCVRLARDIRILTSHSIKYYSLIQ